MKDTERLANLFHKIDGEMPLQVSALPGAGSARKYFRLQSCEDKCIGVAADSRVDAEAFISLASTLRHNGVRVPKVIGIDSGDCRFYLQNDLGTESLFDLLPKDGRKPSEEVVKLIEEAMKSLAHLHRIPSGEWEDDLRYGAFDSRQIQWDLNYYKYEFLRPLAIDFDENALEDDFSRLIRDIDTLQLPGDEFMYRDFQSRNIMIKDGEPWMIDFQGARKGPGLYDVVSFLWQAKARFPEEFRREMLEVYLNVMDSGTLDGRRPIGEEGKEKRRSGYWLFALLRTLQTLGAYGLRGLIEKKAHFIESIPLGIENLQTLLGYGVLDRYPELKSTAERVMEDIRFRPSEDLFDGLTVKVFSFSYKKGYPADYSGNGGGFMFDCRGMHNPGRYQEYKSLTGMDLPVIEFLESRGEVGPFVDRAIEIMKPTVERYIQRGFRSLQIGFGCTGGQHRSVYCAEVCARILKENFPQIQVILCHREQSVTRIL